MRATLVARHRSDFSDEVLVTCPRCGGVGIVAWHRVSDAPTVRRMTCDHCALVHEDSSSADRISLGLPLSLQVQTRHGVLLAFNEAHLEYIESYVAGMLREERGDGTGLRNRSIISRLPRWVKIAKNRDEVLNAISRARRQLG